MISYFYFRPGLLEKLSKSNDEFGQILSEESGMSNFVHFNFFLTHVYNI